MLATLFLEKLNRQFNCSVEHFSPEVEAELQAYHWPGNVRELVSVIEDAVRNCESTSIQVDDFNLQFNAGRDAQRTRPIQNSESLEDFLNRVERERICEVFSSTHQNKKATAEILKMTRAKLYRRMQSLGIFTDDDQTEGAS